jgi:hypothetical protein
MISNEELPKEVGELARKLRLGPRFVCFGKRDCITATMVAGRYSPDIPTTRYSLVDETGNAHAVWVYWRDRGRKVRGVHWMPFFDPMNSTERDAYLEARSELGLALD